MFLNIKVITKASKNQIKKEAAQYKVYLTAAPINGKANDALIEILAGYFHITKQQIKIVRGLKSKHKMVEII
ncbi:MAG: DUF167 domain-containing protein [Planctomycetota bacterium]